MLCSTSGAVGPSSLDPAAVAAKIQGIGAMNLAKTPIAGVYRVVVATSPPTTFDRVEVPGEKAVRLDLASGRR